MKNIPMKISLKNLSEMICVIRQKGNVSSWDKGTLFLIFYINYHVNNLLISMNYASINTFKKCDLKC